MNREDNRMAAPPLLSRGRSIMAISYVMACLRLPESRARYMPASSPVSRLNELFRSYVPSGKRCSDLQVVCQCCQFLMQLWFTCRRQRC